MRLRCTWFCCLFTVLAVATATVAQEGHPLTGVWYGEWGPPAHRNHVTFVLSWDGKKVNGLINPGPDSFPVEVTLDSIKWVVHMEGDVKDDAGKRVRFVADGKLENIGAYKRTVSGTWSDGTAKSDFKITRH